MHPLHCDRCGMDVAPWQLHSDGDDDVCPDCCDVCNPHGHGDTFAQLVDYLTGLELVPTADGLLDLPATNPRSTQ